MIFDIAILLTWVASGYRLWVLWTHPRAIWRTSFTVSTVASAAALTLYRFRVDIDRYLGAWNLAGLFAHVVLVVSAAFLLVYLDALRTAVVPAGRIGVYIVTAMVAIAVMTLAWLASPVHDRPLTDLVPLADHASVVAYCGVFWLYLAVALALMAWTCLARGRTFRRADLARSVSLLLIGASAVAAIPVLLLWTVSLVLRHETGVQPIRLNDIANAWLPWPVLVNAIGVLSLLAVPYVSSTVTAWRRWWVLRPLWRSLVAGYPGVHLEVKPRGGLLVRAQTRTERAIIEIHDALRLARVEVPSVGDRLPSTQELATALALGHGGRRRAADLLPRAQDRDDDIRQILELATHFRRVAS